MTTTWPMQRRHKIKVTYNYATHELKTNGYQARLCLKLDIWPLLLRVKMQLRAQLVHEDEDGHLHDI